ITTASLGYYDISEADYEREARNFFLEIMFASAFEHAAVQQMQSTNLPAASTVQLLQLASTNSQKIFLATGDNWTSVKTQLTNYDLDALGGAIDSGYELLLPQNGFIQLSGTGTWGGYGIAALLAVPGSLELDMLI